MRTIAFRSKGTDLTKFKNLPENGIPKDIIEKTQDFGHVPWQELSDNKIISKDWIQERAIDVYEEYSNTVDCLFFFVEWTEWESKERTVGWHLGRTFMGYEVCIVKIRDGYEDTAEHEYGHTYNNIVHDQLGINLNHVVGVKDWDEDVIHARNRHYVEYEYDDVFQQVSTYVNNAVDKRREDPTWIGNAIVGIRRFRRYLKNRQNPQEKILTTKRNKEEGPKENKLLLWAEGIKKAEGWKPGSLTYRQNNPGALRWSPYQDGTKNGFSYFDSYDTGWKALVHQLRIIAEGTSKAYTREAKRLYGYESPAHLTIREWVDIWAPPTDGNPHNDNYAEVVADTIGVDTDTPVGDLIN